MNEKEGLTFQRRARQRHWRIHELIGIITYFLILEFNLDVAVAYENASEHVDKV